MILAFKDKETKTLYETGSTRRFSQISRVAIRKLIQLDETIAIEDLAVPPGNRLEALKGDRLGQHSIRINSQFRICFIWNGKDVEFVEICDYHITHNVTRYKHEPDHSWRDPLGRIPQAT